MYVSDGTNSLKYAVKDNTLDIVKILKQVEYESARRMETFFD